MDRRFQAIEGSVIGKSDRICDMALNSILPVSKSELAKMMPDVSVTTIKKVLGRWPLRDPSGRSKGTGMRDVSAHPTMSGHDSQCLSDDGRSRLLYINSENICSVQWNRKVNRINCSEPYVFIEKEVTVGYRQRSQDDLQRLHWTTYSS